MIGKIGYTQVTVQGAGPHRSQFRKEAPTGQSSGSRPP